MGFVNKGNHQIIFSERRHVKLPNIPYKYNGVVLMGKNGANFRKKRIKAVVEEVMLNTMRWWTGG